MDLLIAPTTAPPARRALDRWFGTPTALRGWAIASLLSNMVLIVTGAIVRLTQSGLGCPTWPKCEAAGYVPRPAQGIHGAIEFGNRLLTFVLVAVAIATLVTANRTSPDRIVRRLALVAFLGIPAQAVIGGITVLVKLNPFVVSLHLLASLAIVVVAAKLVLRTRGDRKEVASARTLWLVRGTFAAVMVACWVGTIVTGSGPHSGADGSVRTGFNIEHVAKAHAAVVWLAVLGTIGCLILLRRAGLMRSRRRAMGLLHAMLLQAVIGYVQYFTHLPTGLVVAHMIGVALVTAAASMLVFGVGGSERLA